MGEVNDFISPAVGLHESPLSCDAPSLGKLASPGRRRAGKRGTLALDVPIEKTGLISQPYLDQLRAVGRQFQMPGAN
jgi:hypothetical protein